MNADFRRNYNQQGDICGVSLEAWRSMEMAHPLRRGLVHCCGINWLLYNLAMNKKAKKRLKESVQKEIAERSTSKEQGQGHSSPVKKLPESRGFTLRPDKKRG